MKSFRAVTCGEPAGLAAAAPEALGCTPILCNEARSPLPTPVIDRSGDMTANSSAPY